MLIPLYLCGYSALLTVAHRLLELEPSYFTRQWNYHLLLPLLEHDHEEIRWHVAEMLATSLGMSPAGRHALDTRTVGSERLDVMVMRNYLEEQERVSMEEALMQVSAMPEVPDSEAQERGDIVTAKVRTGRTSIHNMMV